MISSSLVASRRSCAAAVARRSLSTIPTTTNEAATSSSKSKGCPFTTPVMNKLPTLPFVGSMIPHHSGVPIFTFDNQYSFNNTMREKFGKLSSIFCAYDMHKISKYCNYYIR